MLRIAVCLLALVYVDAVRDTSFQWFRTRPDCKDVMTEAGLVRGCVDAGGNYFAFLGVPYAAPPTGTYRFKPPVPPYCWKGVFDADRIVRCPQKSDGVEDCLIVNIFSPVNIVNASLPVLVYIHGGSFITGAGPIDGVETLIKQNIIVVTMNYRLGALGFLCLGTEEAPGNAGLKDQVAALKWIQQNIANFGGDPNQVTVYGMDAGGACVEMLVLSHQGRGLFKQAIVESGSATSVWTTDFKPIQRALDLSSKLGINQKNINVHMLGTYYQRASVRKLSVLNYLYYSNLTDGTFGIVPCIEKAKSPLDFRSNSSNAFMTEPLHETLIKEKYDKVPMMFIFSAQEGLFLRSQEYYLQNYRDRMLENFLDFLPADLEFDSAEIRDAISQNIKDFYFGNRTIGDDIINYLNYFGDNLILHSLLNSVEIHSRNDNPVYLMEFAYKGGMGSYDKFYDSVTEAGHGDFNQHVLLNRPPRSKEDKKAIARVTKLVGNFVKYGNPTPDRSHILPILWPRVRPGYVSCLHMDEELRVVDEPHWDAKRFWDGLYSKYRRKITAVGPPSEWP